MNKFVYCLLLSGTMLNSTSFAGNFFHQFITGKHQTHAKQAMHANKITKLRTQDHTNFSGNWSGNCVFEGMEIPMEFSIEDDVEAIYLDGERYAFGSLNTRSLSDSNSASFDHTSVEWNEGKTNLIFKNSYFEKQHSDFPYEETDSMMTFLSKMVLSLNKDQLTIKGQVVQLHDAEQAGEMNLECTLSQKN